METRRRSELYFEELAGQVLKWKEINATEEVLDALDYDARGERNEAVRLIEGIPHLIGQAVDNAQERVTAYSQPVVCEPSDKPGLLMPNDMRVYNAVRGFCQESGLRFATWSDMRVSYEGHGRREETHQIGIDVIVPSDAWVVDEGVPTIISE